MDKLLLGQRLAWARDAAGMTQESLGQAVNLDRTAITRLERGERKLNVAELVEIARALHRPLSYFVDDPVPAVVSRRTDTAHAHATTRLLDIELEQFAGDLRLLLGMQQLPSIERPPGLRVPRSHTEAERLAAEVRRHVGLEHGPLADLGQTCEQLGLYTLSTSLGEGGPDGGCVEVTVDSMTVGAAVINGQAPAGRRRMTLTHELGHWLFGDAYDSEATGDRERMINSFAIYLLAPRSGVQEVWGQHAHWNLRDRALAVGAAFRLSWTATLNQLRNINVIEQSVHRELVEDEPRYGDYLHLGLSWTDELQPGYLSPGFVSAVLDTFTTQHTTKPRALELLRGNLAVDELPRPVTPSRESLHRSFSDHDE